MRVWVSGHALVRFRERFPDEIIGANRVIHEEVTDAIHASRRSPRAPAWASPEYLSGSRSREVRFVWNEQETRCYVIAQRREKGRQVWIVKTTLVRLSDEAIATNARMRAAQTDSGRRKKRKLR